MDDESATPVFGFEKLDVWNDAVDFADLVYDGSTAFPDDERYGLSSQMRRAAVSVSANIAEGSGRSTRGEYAQHVGIAHGILMEVVSLAAVATRRGYLPTALNDRLRREAASIGRRLNGPRDYLTRRAK